MPSIKPTLRPVQEKDQDFLLELYKTSQETLIYEQIPEQLREQLLHSQFALKEQSYIQMYPNGENSIIEVNHDPVGRFFVNAAVDEIRLVDIIICPSARGLGIGSSLLKQLLSHGDAKKIPVRLQVAVNNITAQRLYNRHGFIDGFSDGVHIHCEYLKEG